MSPAMRPALLALYVECEYKPKGGIHHMNAELTELVFICYFVESLRIKSVSEYVIL